MSSLSHSWKVGVTYARQKRHLHGKSRARPLPQVAVDIITWTMGIAAYLSVLFRTVKRGIVAGFATASLLPQCAWHAFDNLPTRWRAKLSCNLVSGQLQKHTLRYCLQTYMLSM